MEDEYTPPPPYYRTQSRTSKTHRHDERDRPVHTPVEAYLVRHNFGEKHKQNSVWLRLSEHAPVSLKRDKEEHFQIQRKRDQKWIIVASLQPDEERGRARDAASRGSSRRSQLLETAYSEAKERRRREGRTPEPQTRPRSLNLKKSRNPIFKKGASIFPSKHKRRSNESSFETEVVFISPLNVVFIFQLVLPAFFFFQEFLFGPDFNCGHESVDAGLCQFIFFLFTRRSSRSPRGTNLESPLMPPLPSESRHRIQVSESAPPFWKYCVWNSRIFTGSFLGSKVGTISLSNIR